MATSDEFPELWHYTTLEGFRGIFQSRMLWATHCHDLNDHSELTRFRIKAESFASDYIRGLVHQSNPIDALPDPIELNQQISDDSKRLLDLFERVTFGIKGIDLPFISCFCHHEKGSYEETHGSLGQWRGYGGAGGVAIVFDTAQLEHMLKQERDVFHHPVNHIGNVCYDHTDITEVEKFRPFFELFPKWIDAILKKVEPDLDVMTPTLETLIHGTTLVKHEAFREENEVRIVMSPRPQNSMSIFYDSDLVDAPVKQLRYRQRGINEVKYIELFDQCRNLPLPIRKIVIGPSRIQNLNYQSVCEIVASAGIKIFRSNTPYIP